MKGKLAVGEGFRAKRKRWGREEARGRKLTE